MRAHEKQMLANICSDVDIDDTAPGGSQAGLGMSQDLELGPRLHAVKEYGPIQEIPQVASVAQTIKGDFETEVQRCARRA